MEDRVVLLNLPSLIWEATVLASLLVEGLKEQVLVINFSFFNSYYHVMI